MDTIYAYKKYESICRRVLSIREITNGQEQKIRLHKNTATSQTSVNSDFSLYQNIQPERYRTADEFLIKSTVFIDDRTAVYGIEDFKNDAIQKFYHEEDLHFFDILKCSAKKRVPLYKTNTLKEIAILKSKLFGIGKRITIIAPQTLFGSIMDSDVDWTTQRNIIKTGNINDLFGMNIIQARCFGDFKVIRPTEVFLVSNPCGQLYHTPIEFVENNQADIGRNVQVLEAKSIESIIISSPDFVVSANIC